MTFWRDVIRLFSIPVLELNNLIMVIMMMMMMVLMMLMMTIMMMMMRPKHLRTITIHLNYSNQHLLRQLIIISLSLLSSFVWYARRPWPIDDLWLGRRADRLGLVAIDDPATRNAHFWGALHLLLCDGHRLRSLPLFPVDVPGAEGRTVISISMNAIITMWVIACTVNVVTHPRHIKEMATFVKSWAIIKMRRRK